MLHLAKNFPLIRYRKTRERDCVVQSNRGGLVLLSVRLFAFSDVRPVWLFVLCSDRPVRYFASSDAWFGRAHQMSKVSKSAQPPMLPPPWAFYKSGAQTKNVL